MNMSKFASAIVAAAISAALQAFAAEWFVSPTGSDAAAGTESAPFRTIQYAVNNANASDTITLLPGDYAEGETALTDTNVSNNRVVIDKPLTLKSKGREYRDSTRIVGAWDETEIAFTAWGMGPAAVRCVWITANGTGTRLEGITFYRGSTPMPNPTTSNGGGDANGSCGGGVMVKGSTTTATVVDCAFVDCQATRGGGIYHDSANNSNLKVVRCLFKRCRDTKFGAAMRGGAAYFCVFDDCSMARNSSGNFVGDGSTTEGGNARAAFAYGNRAINCTFVNNCADGILIIDNNNRFAGGIYNCLFQNNNASSNKGSIRGTPAATNNNVIGEANLYTKFEVFSPFDNDYRLTCNATALNAGAASYLSNVPEEFRTTDYNGTAFDATGETIHAGAVQTALEVQANGVQIRRVSGASWRLGGEDAPICTATWKASIGWPSPQHVGFVADNPASLALVRYTFSNSVHWPLRDDSVWVVPRNGQVQQITTVSTGDIFYADPVNGDDANVGTESAPFKTLNAAVQASTSRHVVRAKAGDYRTAEAETGSGLIKNRVVVPKTLNGDLRVVAVDGPDSTFITGASDSSDTTNGTGTAAIRCIAVLSTNANYAAFQGFTLRNGRTAMVNINDSFGGAMRNFAVGDTSDLGTAFLLDCVVENCIGRRGGAVAGGTALRCKFKNCLAANSGGGVFRGCTVASSLIDGCGGNSELFTYNGAQAYNCTIVNSSAGAVSTKDGAACLYNCVAALRKSGYNTFNSNVGGGAINTLYDTIDSNVTAGTGSVQENPVLFARKAQGDYHLKPASAGNSLASTSYMKSCMDMNGEPFVFNTANGTYPAGCYAAILSPETPFTLIFR